MVNVQIIYFESQMLFKAYVGAYCIAGHHSGLPDGGTPGDSAGVVYPRKYGDYAVTIHQKQIPETVEVSRKI